MRIEILEGTGPTALTKQWRIDGDVVDAGVVTYDVVDPDGTSQQSGTATKTGTGSTTAYTVTLPVALADEPTVYQVTWTRSDTGAVLVDDVEVVGSVLFTESDARTFPFAGINPLADANVYTDRAIAEARYRVAELLERRCGASMTRRFGRVRLPGSGRRRLSLAGTPAVEQTHGGPGFRRRPLRVLSASVNGVALTAGELAAVHADNFGFERLDGLAWDAATSDQPRANVVVAYEYGWRSVPWEAHRAGLILLMKSVVSSDLPSRATSFSNPDGTFRLSTPSLNHPTGIPEIDEFIVAYDERPVFA